MHKNNQNFIIIKSFFSWFTIISKNAFILGGSVLYFAYYIFRSIDISTLSIQYIFLGILNFLSSRNNGFCKKYPIQKYVQLCSTVSIGTTYNKHVWQHIPPHKCGTCSNKTSIGKLTSDSPLLTIVDMERKKEGTPGV